MGIVIAAFVFLISAIAVARLIYKMSGPPPDGRYCSECDKVTQWHPIRGCEHCAWMDRQW